MTHLPLETLQAAILYSDQGKMASRAAFFSFVIANLNAALAEKAGMFTAINAPDGASFGLIGNPQNTLHITIEMMDEPMGFDGFQTALNGAYYRSIQPELVDRVNTHASAVLVGVGLGTTPFPLDHPLISQLGMASDLGGDQDQDKFELRLLILQTLSGIICRMSEPNVVHWAQSHQLFTPETFLKHADTGFSLPLYIACGVQGSQEKVGNSYKIGILGFGSQHLIGHCVKFEEHARPYTRSYQSVLGFVAHCRAIGRVPEHGETLQEPNGDIIEVHHFRTPDVPLPQILLRLRQNASDHPETSPAHTAPVPQPGANPSRPEAAGFADLRGAMKSDGGKPSSPARPTPARPSPETRADLNRPAQPPRSNGPDRLRQALDRAKNGTTAHSLQTAVAEPAKTAGAGIGSAPAAPLGSGVPLSQDALPPLSGGPTDWIKDHVRDNAAQSTNTTGRAVKVVIACVCLYVIVQVVAPMTDMLAITTLN